jgi:hypothetical protein
MNQIIGWGVVDLAVGIGLVIFLKYRKADQND